MRPDRLTQAAIEPLRTLDPAAPLDDLEWLDAAVGDARLVAIGESAHYNAESFLLRHRLLRYLVERHGFTAYALESGFLEAARVDAWVHGSDDRLEGVMADGLTSLMGLWAPVRDHLTWMRAHNALAPTKVAFHGIDLPGSNSSLLPGLSAVSAFLAQADPELDLDPALGATASRFAAMSPFSAPATLAGYMGLSQPERDALTAGLADLASRMRSRRLDYTHATSGAAYEWACEAVRLTVALDGLARNLARGDQQSMMFDRDRAIADTVEWILRRERRVVLAAHNGHVLRWPAAMPGLRPATPAGLHLADRLGADYRVIGVTTGTGQTLSLGADFYAGRLFGPLPAPDAGSLDALLHASHDGLFGVDLRRLSPPDTASVGAATRQRFGPFYSEVDALAAYDVLVHLPVVTPAETDTAAVASSPADVQEAFRHWRA